MSKRTYIIYNIVTGLFKGAALFAIVLWLLPLWGIVIPLWGLILILIAFLIYEFITFNLGKKALEKKPVIWDGAIIGCCGKATTPLTPHGYVQIHGELWHARAQDVHIEEGAEIVVLEMNRITLGVAPVTEK